jgi:hypothetical protein
VVGTRQRVTVVEGADSHVSRTFTIADAGLDTEQLTAYARPDPVVPAVAQLAAALALVLLVTAVAVSMARAQVVALRRYLSTLLAIGISPAWTRRVLLTQQGLALGLATVLGLLIAVPPVVAAAIFVPDVQLSVPETSLAGLLLCVYAAAFGVTLMAARFIHADGGAGGYE